MTSYPPESGLPLESDERLVRTSFEAAVGRLTMDSTTLVTGGLVAGRAMARRRRWQTVAGVLAVVAVLTAGGVALQRGLTDSNAGPVDRPEQLVPATPRALAAAVLADLPDGVQVVAKGGVGSGASDGILEADLRLRVGDQEIWLDTVAAPGSDVGDVTCRATGASSSCLGVSFPNGDRLVSGSRGPRTTYVVVIRGTDAVAVQEQVIGSASGPPPLPLSVLRRIGTDPLVGTQTSHDMVSAGRRLGDFTREGRLAGGLAGSVHVSGHGSARAVHVKPRRSPPSSAGR